MSFKVGDKVKIREDSKYYVGSKRNPIGVPGKVQEILSTSEIWVSWENGAWNDYTAEDLELWSEPTKKDYIPLKEALAEAEKKVEEFKATLVKQLIEDLNSGRVAL